MNRPDSVGACPPDDLDLRSLVHRDRVHGSVYTSNTVFTAELARIFEHSWVYIGHGAEVPAAGDYRVRLMGRQQVIMLRGDDGQVRVFMNRCTHRGSQLCEQRAGNARYLTCWYHGWVFDDRGALRDLVNPAGYGDDFDRTEFALACPPRVDEYRGFVFAALSEQVPPLQEHLGLARAYIDLFLDASPSGEITLDAGVQRTAYNGNWKFVGMDGYHPYFTHKSVLDMWQKRAGENLSATHRGDPFADDSGNVTRDLGNGHVLLDMYPGRARYFDEYLAGLRQRPGGEAYIASMEAAYGPERARELLIWAGDPHLGVYPNLQLIGSQIRIVNPLAADRTEVFMFPTRLVGVPESINTLRLRTHESFYGPASQGSPDDAEIFERNQIGLLCEVNPWVYLGRGLQREYLDSDGSIVGLVTDETTQRGQLRQWARLMLGKVPPDLEPPVLQERAAPGGQS